MDDCFKRIFLEDFFWRNFFEGIFLEDFFEGIFGGFFLKDFFGRNTLLKSPSYLNYLNLKGIDAFVKILSEGKEENFNP